VTQPTPTPFDPAQVPINYTLNFHQVNLILEGLSELPRKKSEGFYEQFRSVALQTLQIAEQAAKDAAEKAAADEAARNAEPEAATAESAEA